MLTSPYWWRIQPAGVFVRPDVHPDMTRATRTAMPTQRMTARYRCTEEVVTDGATWVGACEGVTSIGHASSPRASDHHDSYFSSAPPVLPAPPTRQARCIDGI